MGWDDGRLDDAANGVEKLLPQNQEAERGLLGSLLIDPEVIATVYAKTGLRAYHFYNHVHETIFRCAHELWDQHEPADLITLTDELGRRGKLEEVGGISYVSSLANQVPTSRNAVHYAQIILRCAFLRELIRFAGDAAGIAYSEPDGDAAYSVIMGKLLKVGERYAQGSGYFRDIADVLEELHAETMRRVDGGIAGVLIPTGFSALDKIVVGYEPGELHTFCARPGGLKSTVALNMARNMAEHLLRTDTAGSIGYVTLEMSDMQQARRLIAAHTGQSALTIRAGFHSPDDLLGAPDDEAVAQFTEGVATFGSRYKGRLRLCDRALTLGELRVALSEAVAVHQMKVCFVDQADLFDEEGRHQEGDTALVAAVCKRLKRLAQSLGITIVLLAQLGRQVEQQANKRAQRHMAKNSGRIEQDSSGLYFIHFPYLWQPDRTGAEDASFRAYADITIAKLREGRPNKLFPIWVDAASAYVCDWPADEPLPDLREEEDQTAEKVETVGGPTRTHYHDPQPGGRWSRAARPDRNADNLTDWKDWRQRNAGDGEQVVDADPDQAPWHGADEEEE